MIIDEWKCCQRCRCKFKKLKSKTMCASCCLKMSHKQSKRLADAKANGLCTTCIKVKPETATNTCNKCKQHNKNRVKRNRANGKCGNCGKLSIKPKIYLCEKCWFKLCAYNNLGTRNRWEEIQDLFYKQNQICMITGTKLNLGENTSLDHIIPKSRGGSNELENLQWITTKANHFKNDKTMKELIELCKLILDRLDK